MVRMHFLLGTAVIINSLGRPIDADRVRQTVDETESSKQAVQEEKKRLLEEGVRRAVSSS